jgi:hypothetical protein
MSSPHSFGLSSRVNKYSSTRILSPSTLHIDSMHGSHLVCYFLVNSLHHFYVSHGRFYDRIEASLEESYSTNVLMTYCCHIYNTVDRFYQVIIFPTSSLFLFQVQLLIFYNEHVCACLGLYG